MVGEKLEQQIQTMLHRTGTIVLPSYKSARNNPNWSIQAYYFAQKPNSGRIALKDCRSQVKSDSIDMFCSGLGNQSSHQPQLHSLPSTIAENQPVGTIVGEFNATDPDANATLTYYLVSGVGDGNNSLFTLDTNGTLKTATTFDYETNASTYSIRVQARDEYNATVEGNFTVTLTDDSNEDTDGDGFTDAQEISAGTNQNDPGSKPGLDFGLVAWYPFDGNASDMSGNGRNGINFQVNTLTNDRFGFGAKAVTFDGSNALQFSNPVNGFSNAFISFWAKRNANDSGSVVFRSPIGNINFVHSNAIWFYVQEDRQGGTITNGLSYRHDSENSLTSPIGNILLSTYTPIIRQDCSLMGYRKHLPICLWGTIPVDMKIKFIGVQGNHSIDEVRVYNRTLSATEVLSLYELEKLKLPLNDSNFQTAINLWFSDETNATNTYGHIRDWNTSAVTNMHNAFLNRTNFNEDISGWDVSSVTNMINMFNGASSFNQDIGNWNRSR